MTITIVGLGPGNGRFLTREAWEILSNAGTVYLRTARHPAVDDLPDGLELVSFDSVYETAVDFSAVYTQIVETLLNLGREEDIVYAVPGHPHVGESTTPALIAAASEQDIAIKIISGLSFVEPMLTALGVDILDGLQVHDALSLNDFFYPPINSDMPLLIAQVYSRLIASRLKEVLTAVYPDEHTVQLIHAAGTNEELVEAIPLYAIDHSPHSGHLTSLYVPSLPQVATITALAETVAVLRSPDGCPWDQEQTSQSLRSGLLEEASEVLDAIDMQDQDNLCEELGDVLYHLVMQAQIAAEAGEFTLTDVLAGIEAKLKRRHPHVWGDWQVDDSEHVVQNWEMLKQQEKGRVAKSKLDGIPQALPALARSQKIQGRVAKVGFDWPDVKGVWEKLSEEVDEFKESVTDLERQSELGDILFVLTNLARWHNIDAETALRESNMRFSARFKLVEEMITQRGLAWEQLDLPSMDKLWREAKKILENAANS